MYKFDKNELKKYVGVTLYKYVIKTEDNRYFSYKYNFEYKIGEIIEDPKCNLNKINGIYCCNSIEELKRNYYHHCKDNSVILKIKANSVNDIKWVNDRQEILLSRCFVIGEN